MASWGEGYTLAQCGASCCDAAGAAAGGTHVGGCHEQGLCIRVVGGQSEEDDSATLHTVALHPGGRTQDIIPYLFSGGELPPVQTQMLRTFFSEGHEALTEKERAVLILE